MTPELFRNIAVRPALSILPSKMASVNAMNFLVAIALQESGLEHRRQVGGPARSFFQGELTGGMCTGVPQHPATRDYCAALCDTLGYKNTSPWALYEAIEHNDVLAAGLARLLLWTLPYALPEADDPERAWSQYLSAWRPGRPHRHTWDGNFARAWSS